MWVELDKLFLCTGESHTLAIAQTRAFSPTSSWHRGGMPLPITDDTFGDMQSIEDVLTAEEKSGFRPVSAELKRGEASFHHPLMVHGSYANK